MTDKYGNNDFGVAVEHASLREEVLSRIKMRQQLIAGTLVLGGAFMAAGIQIPAIALLYPPLAAFLAVAWAQSDYKIRELAQYLRDNIEPRFTTPGWETYLESQRKSKGVGAWRYVVLSHGGMFIFTQSLALLVGVLWLVSPGEPTLPHLYVTGWVLAFLDVVAIFVVIWCITKALRS